MHTIIDAQERLFLRIYYFVAAMKGRWDITDAKKNNEKFCDFSENNA